MTTRPNKIIKWCLLIALAAAALPSVVSERQVNSKVQHPAKREAQEAPPPQLNYGETDHKKLSTSTKTDDHNQEERILKKGNRKKKRVKHTKVHHCKKKHKKHKKKSHKCHGSGHKQAKMPIETTTFDLFGNPTMTPINFEGSGEFFILGRSGGSYWDAVKPGEIVPHKDASEDSTTPKRPTVKTSTDGDYDGDISTTDNPEQKTSTDSQSEAPSKIEDVSISDDVEDGKIHLQWYTPEDNKVPIKEYIVKVLDSNGNEVQNIPVHASDTKVEITGLSVGDNYTISIVAVSDHDVESEPAEQEYQIPSGSMPVSPTDVKIEYDDESGIFITPPNSNVNISIEAKDDDGNWVQYPINDDGKIVFDKKPEEIRVETIGDGGKRSDPIIEKIKDLPLRLNCPQNKVARCEKACVPATCDNLTLCSDDLAACSKNLQEQFCDCDYSNDYVLDKYTDSCIPKSQCVSCQNGTVPNCPSCADDSCKIAWEENKYCEISTESCTEKPHCNCDNKNGLFWDNSTNQCVDKETCLSLIKCDIVDTEPQCLDKVNRIAPACDIRYKSEHIVTAPLDCPISLECVCRKGMVFRARANKVCVNETNCASILSVCPAGSKKFCKQDGCEERTIADIEANKPPRKKCDYAPKESCDSSKHICVCDEFHVRNEKKKYTDRSEYCVAIQDVVKHYINETNCPVFNDEKMRIYCRSKTCYTKNCTNFYDYELCDSQYAGTEKHLTDLLNCGRDNLFCDCFEWLIDDKKKACEKYSKTCKL